VRIIPAEKKIQFTFHLNSANTVAPCEGLLVTETNKKRIGGINKGHKIGEEEAMSGAVA
jgi:hypothetical protein